MNCSRDEPVSEVRELPSPSPKIELVPVEIMADADAVLGQQAYWPPLIPKYSHRYPGSHLDPRQVTITPFLVNGDWELEHVSDDAPKMGNNSFNKWDEFRGERLALLAAYALDAIILGETTRLAPTPIRNRSGKPLGDKTLVVKHAGLAGRSSRVTFVIERHFEISTC